MKQILFYLLPALFSLFSCSNVNIPEEPKEKSPEVIYYIFTRSFYDSDGDRQGDLKGIQQKLDYLQDLGVTSILTTPLCFSSYYHNYFPVDLRKIDPEYGTKEDFENLIKEIHKRGMKFYLDMEPQYITDEHIWYKLSRNAKPTWYDSSFFSSTAFPLLSYDGQQHRIFMVNLHNPRVSRYIYDVFRSLVDPDGDGFFNDGVDGFRIDHMMDNLDHLGLDTNLFTGFWRPLFLELRKMNPELKIIAEQANWLSLGKEYFENADVDMVFAFRLRFAIVSFDRKQIMVNVDSALANTPQGKQQIVFLENHDLDRIPTIVGSETGKLKVAATLNMFFPGTPMIYYGQELGMRGRKLHVASDGDIIPCREAFEWYNDYEHPGMAIWYKNTGPWWDSTFLRKNDKISLEEERNDSSSLWNFYRTLISLRKKFPALSSGSYSSYPCDQDQVFVFKRRKNQEEVLVAVNLSDSVRCLYLNGKLSRMFLNRSRYILGSDQCTLERMRGDTMKIVFQPFATVAISQP
ncbi:MAG: DUF3459 domain-containing protein [Bacteroidales bacterium]|nr:DUF3459 domain-containing protein [Bacteroidales bacterium]